MNYFRLHIGDYLRDAAHLSPLEDGMYFRAMRIYYTREAGIPDADKYRLTGARLDDERTALDVVLREFFTLVDGMWVQTRCEREIAAYREKAERNREVGRLGGRPVKQKNPEETQMVSKANPQETLANSHKPIAIKEEKKNTRAARDVVRPDGVDESVWTDWLALRKAKRAPLTQTALDGVEREARKAGMGLGEALAMCCQRGWAGFEAGWVQPSPRASPRALPSASALDRQAEVLHRITGGFHGRSATDARVIDAEPATFAPRIASGGG